MRRWPGFLSLFLLVVAGPTSAATWRVAKDGTGDFSVIQDAVDSASSGDTILLAPGRYDDTHVFVAPGGSIIVHAIVSQADLTIRGEDRHTVIVGPETLDPDTEAFGLITNIAASMTIENLTVEHMFTAVQGNGDRIEVRDCDIRECTEFGVDSWALYATRVLGCKFLDVDRRGVILFGGRNSVGVEIGDCVFESTVSRGMGIDLQTEGNVVHDCTFRGTRNGLQFTFGATGVVSNCFFENIDHIVLSSLSTSNLQLIDCVIAGISYIDLIVSQGSHLAGNGNILAGGSFTTIEYTFESSMDFHGNHILNGGSYSVLTAGGEDPPSVLDLSDNYWGTTDADQIAEWIIDGYDSPQIKGTIEFVPFFGQPVASETSSFGRLKSLFGSSP